MATLDIPLGERDRPIVILAVPRSGSQLTRSLLNAHPQIFVAAHSDIFGRFSDVLAAGDPIEADLREEFFYTRRTAAHLHEFFRVATRAFWTTSDEPWSLNKATANRWGFLCYDLPLEPGDTSWLELFPQARFLHVLRDGRDVVASWLANWQEAARRMPVVRRDAAEVARVWVEWNRAAEAYPALRFRLEDLADPTSRDDLVRRIFAHCDVTPTPETERFARALPWVNASRQAPGRWRQDLDDMLLARSMAVPGFAETLRQWRYA